MNANRLSIAYAEALARYLQEAGEEALHGAYELGREAMALRVSIVELARMHHAALEEAVVRRRAADYGLAVRSGGEFLSEALSAFEMVRLGYEEVHDKAIAERQHATLIRRLSTLLADTSLAYAGNDSLTEILQLVVEGAVELTAADGCLAIVGLDDAEPRVVALSGSVTERSHATLVVPLTALDGRLLGTLGLVYGASNASELDEAVLAHLGQMAAATVERSRSYGRAPG